MRRQIALLLALLFSTSVAVREWATKSWEIGGKSFGNDALLIRHEFVERDLKTPDFPDNVGIGKYLKTKIPVPSEIPELAESNFWSYLYAYDNLAYWYDRTSSRPYAAGYDVDLITSKNCNPNPFKGSCFGGRITARVNAKNEEFVSNFKMLEVEPIPNTKSVELAYGVKGYIDSSTIQWLEKGAKYNIVSIGDKAIEFVLLANSGNLDLKSKTGVNKRQTLLGKVGNANVNMLLRRSGSWLWGTYYYDQGKKPAITDRLYVVGEVKNGKFQLREYDLTGYPDKLPAGNTIPTTAVWSGTLTDQGVLKGTVTNSRTKKTFSASLQPQR